MPNILILFKRGKNVWFHILEIMDYLKTFLTERRKTKMLMSFLSYTERKRKTFVLKNHTWNKIKTIFLDSREKKRKVKTFTHKKKFGSNKTKKKMYTENKI